MKNFFFGSKEEPEKNPFVAKRSVEGGDDSFLTGDELRDRKNIQLLLEAIGDVSSTLSLETLLTDIVDKAIELSRAERGLLLMDREGKVHVKLARDAKKQTLFGPIQYSTTLAQQVAQTRKPLRKMVSSDSEAADLAQSVFDLKLRAVMCAPLMVKEKLIGVIYVDSRAAEREFSKTDLSFFNALSRQLAIAIENARLVADSLEKARLEQELSIASEIQRGLLPDKPPQILGLDIHGWYTPCEEATGDSYDFFPLDSGALALMLGDVSGHGIGPALLAATARAALRAYLKVLPDLGKVADRLNQDLQKDLKTGTFMTLFLARYDAATQRLDYLNAGHPSPIFLRQGESARCLEEFEPAFGFHDETSFRSNQIKLQTGDLILAYSDGLVEARSPKGEVFGLERLQKTIERLRDKTAKETVEAAVQEVLEFSGGKRSDDLTLFALRVCGDGS